jgi:hypothetical protein
MDSDEEQQQHRRSNFTLILSLMGVIVVPGGGFGIWRVGSPCRSLPEPLLLWLAEPQVENPRRRALDAGETPFMG